MKSSRENGKLQTVKLKKITTGVFSSFILFGAPTQKLVETTKNSEVIRIWSLKSYKLLASEEVGELELHQVLKWDTKSFLVSSEDGKVTCFRIMTRKPFFEFIRTLDFGVGGIIRMLKLRIDLLLCMSQKRDIFVVRYSTGAVISELDREYIRDENKSILLINYEKNELENVFMNHDQTEIYSLCSFVNSKKEEILFVAGLERKIYLYNTSRKDQNVDFLTTIETENYITSLLCLQTRTNETMKGAAYLVVGDYYGNLSIEKVYSSESETCTVFSTKRVLREKIHKDQICLLERHSSDKFDPHFASFISSSDDSTLRVFRVSDIFGFANAVIRDEEDHKLPEFFERFECVKTSLNFGDLSEEEEGEEDCEEKKDEKYDDVVDLSPHGFGEEEDLGEFDIALFESTIDSILQQRNRNVKLVDELSDFSKISKLPNVDVTAKKPWKKKKKKKKKSGRIRKNRSKNKAKEKPSFQNFYERHLERMERLGSPKKALPGPARYSPSNYIYTRTEHSRKSLNNKKTLSYKKYRN